MKRSNNKHKLWEQTALIYTRLSRDDDLEGESYSIANQRKLLVKVAKEKGYSKFIYFVDDGVSGVTMNRPGFQKMIEAIENGVASAVFVKDLSRLGRNYIEVGKLTEEFFPLHRIRLVAVSDGIDSADGESEYAPIKNIFNEWYARDISKKRRMSNKIRGASGEPLSAPPYGYIKNPENPKHWIVDEEAAQVVRRIDSLTLEGLGTDQIAAILTQDKVLTPIAYAVSKGIRKPANSRNPDPYHWNSSAICRILSMQEYCGDIINFKTYSVSFKNKKRYENAPEDMVIFENAHEAIRDRDTFEKIQQLRKKSRRRPTQDGERNMFSGLLVCADCGSNLHYHFSQANHAIHFFSCSGYNRGTRKICDKTHYIRVDFLEKIVLAEIRRLTRFACHHEDAFTKEVADYSKRVTEAALKNSQAELRVAVARHNELDRLFQRLYEDNVSGKISDDRFKKMMSQYEDEQLLLEQKIDALRESIDQTEEKVLNTESFMAAVKKYTRIKKLTPRMLIELIEKIEVFHAEKVDGVKTQRIIIHYNCIGAIEIPDDIKIPEPQIELNTRKGVTVQYTA